MDEKIIAALFGLIGGTIGSLVAPWIHWAVERRRTQLANRKEQIADLRRLATQMDLHELFDTAEYAALRPHLSTQALSRIEGQRVVHIVMGRDRQPSRENTLFDEIARIEREWKLV